MAALVSLDVAKSHLRVVDSVYDEDIQRKVEQASAVILDFLKSRVHETATVSTSSVASPTVITTAAEHGYTSGATVIISGHADSTPDINGSYVLTVLSTTTFSVPVAVTVAGTGGTATVEWTVDTVPMHVESAVLLMLTHLYENRGNDMKADEALWRSITRLLERSRDPAFA